MLKKKGGEVLNHEEIKGIKRIYFAELCGSFVYFAV